MNNSQVHSKSSNVFSMAPPTTLSGTSNGFASNGVYRSVSLDDYDSLVSAQQLRLYRRILIDFCRPQPSSNEITSNESITNTENDPFSLSGEIGFEKKEVSPKPTSPKSSREYITSFTTTTTTTQKPHIEKGVKIIRNLVEQARATEQPDINRPIQSLTTTKTLFTDKERPVSTQNPKASTAVPANHRPTWVYYERHASGYCVSMVSTMYSKL